MKKQIPEDEKSCWNCKKRIYKSRPGGPYNFCKYLKEFFAQHEKLDEKVCTEWEY